MATFGTCFYPEDDLRSLTLAPLYLAPGIKYEVARETRLPSIYELLAGPDTTTPAKLFPDVDSDIEFNFTTDTNLDCEIEMDTESETDDEVPAWWSDEMDATFDDDDLASETSSEGSEDDQVSLDLAAIGPHENEAFDDFVDRLKAMIGNSPAVADSDDVDMEDLSGRGAEVSFQW